MIGFDFLFVLCLIFSFVCLFVRLVVFGLIV